MESVVKKLYRDPDNKKIAGVCSGVAIYLGLDVTVLRIIFLIAAIFGCAGLWIYLIIWLIAPEAKTPIEKCELRGLPPIEENIKELRKE